MTHIKDPVGKEDHVSPWLASLLLRREDVLPRFSTYLAQLQQMPRAWRRRLQRRLSLTVAGAALLLAMMAPTGFAAPDATINVVNGQVAIVNNGKCSLMEAIINARATSANQLRSDCAAGNLNGPDTIVLPAGGLFTITTPHNAQFGPTGLPVITQDMTILGNGATIRRSSTADPFRIMAVDPDVNLTLNNMTIRGGETYYNDGGGILNQGNLTIIGSNIADNFVFGDSGGGIKNTGTLIMTDSVVSGNEAWDNYYAYGGGIAGGDLTISGSIFINNASHSDYGYGGAVTSRGSVVITNSSFESNEAGFGGALATWGDTTISGSIFTGNSATGHYGNDGDGGAVLIKDGTATIVNSTVSGNTATSHGGGIANEGNLTVVNSTVTDNSALFSYDGSVFGNGGGIAGLNRHDYPDDYYPECSVTTLQQTLVSGNTAGAVPESQEVWLVPPGHVPPEYACESQLIADSHNLFGHDGDAGVDGFTPGASDIVPSQALNAILDTALTNNGGPTLTHALVTNSPALDRVPNAIGLVAPVNGVDQRGRSRNENGVGGVTNHEGDIGAFELGGAPPPPVSSLFYISPTGNGKVGGVSFAPADILRYDQTQNSWAMFFDGSDVKATKNLSGFAIQPNNDLLLTWLTNQPIPGQGTFSPQDIVRFVPTQTGDTTARSFEWYFDGSDVGLSTSIEKIDALGILPDGRLLISTVGTASVPGPGGTTIRAEDEDILAFTPTSLGATTSGTWALYFDGTPIPGLKVEDINGFWHDSATGDHYITILGAFKVGGVKGNGKDILKLTPDSAAPGGYAVSKYWDGAAFKFPSNLDALEMQLP